MNTRDKNDLKQQKRYLGKDDIRRGGDFNFAQFYLKYWRRRGLGPIQEPTTRGR